MKAKELKIVVTFHTTTESIHMEKKCKADGIPGRLIPVPRQISAGCGLAWSAPVEDGGKLREYMDIHNLQFETVGEYWI